MANKQSTLYYFWNANAALLVSGPERTSVTFLGAEQAGWKLEICSLKAC